MGVWNGYESFIGNRTFGVVSTRANVGGDGLSAWTNVAVTSVSSAMAYLNKRTFGHTFLPTFAYKREHLDLTGAISISQSINNYAGAESRSWPGNTVGGTSISTTGMTASAAHPADNNYAWSVVQTGGLDWGSLNSYHASATADPTFSEDGRYARNLVYQAKADAKVTTGWKLPTWFQFGAKVSETYYDYQNPTSWQTWNYIGPGGGPGGSWSQFPSSFAFSPGNGANIRSDTGATPAVQNHNAIGYLFASQPQDFVSAGTAGAYLASFVNNSRQTKEQVDSGYAMADTRLFRRLELQAGIRFERSMDEVKNFQSLPTSQVVAAGYPVTTAGIASTIPGIQYQYFTLPRAATATRNGNYYPSASAKYSFTPNLLALFGYSYTVTRPSYNDIAGVTTIDDENQTINLPNTSLKPKTANNYSARLTYYFEPVGSLGLSGFENVFSNYSQTQTLPDAAPQFGFTDPQYASYSVITKVNLPADVIYRGMTLEWSQGMPRPLDHFHLFANFTRVYAEVTGVSKTVLEAATPYNYGWLPGVTPFVVNYGATYHFRRITLGASARWDDKEPYSGTYNVWQKQRTKVDAHASFALDDHLSLIFQGRNIFDVPDYDYLGTPTHIFAGRGIEYYGAYFYSGLKGTF